jgi:AraC-like DNA-binding protein
MSAQELAVLGLGGSALGAVLGTPLVWPRATRSWDARLLGVMLLSTSALAALISARLAGLVAPVALVEHAINLLGLSALPVVVLYTRRAAADLVGLRDAAWLWGPAVAYFTAACGRGLLGQDTRVPFAWLLPAVLAFTVLSALPLQRPTRVNGVLVQPGWVVGFLIVLNAAQIVRLTLGHLAPVRAVVPLAISGAFVTLVAFIAWKMANVPGGDSTPAAAKYSRSGLDADEAREFLARIEATLARDRLFARPDLTLATLASVVGCTPHQLSEALNRFGGTSFRDLVQRRRVDDVKAQLDEPDSERFTIEGVGVAAGFRSRSAFYEAFRRLEGMTPAEYRASRRRHP